MTGVICLYEDDGYRLDLFFVVRVDTDTLDSVVYVSDTTGENTHLCAYQRAGRPSM